MYILITYTQACLVSHCSTWVAHPFKGKGKNNKNRLLTVIAHWFTGNIVMHGIAVCKLEHPLKAQYKISVCIHTHTHTRTHTCARRYMHVYTHAHAHTHTHMHTHTCIATHMCTCTHTHTHTHTHHVRMRARTRTHIHTHTHAHTHTHTHAHTLIGELVAIAMYITAILTVIIS